MIEITTEQAVGIVKDATRCVIEKDVVCAAGNLLQLGSYVAQRIHATHEEETRPLVFGADGTTGDAAHDFAVAIEQLGTEIDPAFAVPMGAAGPLRDQLVKMVIAKFVEWLKANIDVSDIDSIIAWIIKLL